MVVVLWSKQSIESDWVRDEAAQGRDRRRLVPLSLDGTLPPLGFRQMQMIDLSDWRGRGDAPQMEAIEPGDRDRGSAQEPRRSRRGRGRDLRAGRRCVGRRRRRPPRLAGGGALVAWERGLIGAGAGQARSIAVLPFKDLSGVGKQAYLSDG